MKLEELENQVFQLKSENMALKKSIEVMENELAKARAKEDDYAMHNLDLETELNEIMTEFKDLKFRYSLLEQR